MYKIKEWSSFQSYKDRSPPWIRLHKKLLDDYNFQRMSVEARALLPMLWLIASEDKDPVSGMLRMSYEEISFRLRQDVKKTKATLQEIVKSGFIEDLSISYGTVTERLRICHSETETYKEETETEEALFLFNACAKENGFSQVQKMTKPRKAKLKARLNDCGGIEGWKTALAKLSSSPFCRGENERGWKADFDFLTAESSFVKLMEGKYDKTEKKINSQLKEMINNGW